MKLTNILVIAALLGTTVDAVNVQHKHRSKKHHNRAYPGVRFVALNDPAPEGGAGDPAVVEAATEKGAEVDPVPVSAEAAAEELAKADDPAAAKKEGKAPKVTDIKEVEKLKEEIHEEEKKLNSDPVLDEDQEKAKMDKDVAELATRADRAKRVVEEKQLRKKLGEMPDIPQDAPQREEKMKPKQEAMKKLGEVAAAVVEDKKEKIAEEVVEKEAEAAVAVEQAKIDEKKAMIAAFDKEKEIREKKLAAELKAKQKHNPIAGSEKLKEAQKKIADMIEKDEAEAEAKKKKQMEIEPNAGIAASEAAMEEWEEQQGKKTILAAEAMQKSLENDMQAKKVMKERQQVARAKNVSDEDWVANMPEDLLKLQKRAQMHMRMAQAMEKRMRNQAQSDSESSDSDSDSDSDSGSGSDSG